MLAVSSIIGPMYGPVFWICDENSVDNKNVLLLNSAIPIHHPSCTAHKGGDKESEQKSKVECGKNGGGWRVILVLSLFLTILLNFKLAIN